MDHWDEMRTAARVAQLGTVSAAAEALGVHRSTVIRHVDTLEEALGAKLFQRHARGYTPTELGRDLARVADATDDQFRQFARRATDRNESLEGELIVTSVEVMAPSLVPLIQQLRATHPKLRVSYRVSERVYRLEYGEADIAIRMGPRPDEPDNVVKKIAEIAVGLYGHTRYLAAFGEPRRIADLGDHEFVALARDRAPTSPWLREHVPDERIVFSTPSLRVAEVAVMSGMGLGFLRTHDAEQGSQLRRVLPGVEITASVWVVTHVDLHRTPKVQALLSLLSAGDFKLRSEYEWCGIGSET